MAQRVNVTFDSGLLERIDNHCKGKYTRSSFIALCCDTYLHQEEALGQIKTLNYLLTKVSSNQELSEEDKQLLQTLGTLLTVQNLK